MSLEKRKDEHKKEEVPIAFGSSFILNARKAAGGGITAGGRITAGGITKGNITKGAISSDVEGTETRRPRSKRMDFSDSSSDEEDEEAYIEKKEQKKEFDEESESDDDDEAADDEPPKEQVRNSLLKPEEDWYLPLGPQVVELYKKELLEDLHASKHGFMKSITKVYVTFNYIIKICTHIRNTENRNK